MESCWRSLDYLVSQVGHKKNIKIKIFDVTKDRLYEDLSDAYEFDQSVIFEKIYEEEFGMAGGEPFSVLLGDYEYSNTSEDIDFLRMMAEVSATSFAPFISNVSPELFGLDCFKDFDSVGNVESIFKQLEYSAWNDLRYEDNMQFVSLALPKFLLRSCKDENGLKMQALWGNACFPFAVILINSFDYSGWFANIRGEGDENNFEGRVISACSKEGNNFSFSALIDTDYCIMPQLEEQLTNLGFMPICYSYQSNFASFYSNSSLRKFINDSDQKVVSNTMLQYIFCACRFAHYVKIIGRNLVGSFTTAEECQSRLRSWLMKYIASNDLSPDALTRVRYPLKRAEIEVKESPENMGHFYCNISLVPGFQLEKMIGTIDLVAKIS